MTTKNPARIIGRALRNLFRRRVTEGGRRRGGGSAGVREPRRPVPTKPLAGAAAPPDD